MLRHLRLLRHTDTWHTVAWITAAWITAAWITTIWLVTFALLPGLGLAETPAVLWTFQGIEDINTLAVLPDVDEDLIPDVVVETYDAGAVGDHLYLLSGGSAGTADIIWSVRPESGVSNGGGYGDNCLITCPDLSGDAFPDVVLGTAWGNRSVHAVNGISGEVLWTFDSYNETSSGWIYSVAWHPDQTGDGLPEIVFGAGSDNNNAYMVDGADGSIRWRSYAPADAVFHTLSLPDVDGDENPDVLFCAGDNDYNIYCVTGGSDPNPAQIWAKNTGASNRTATLIDDVSADGIPDIVVGNWSANTQVMCVDATNGNTIWDFHNGTYQYIMRLVTISDVDNDGYRDVAIGSFDRAVKVISGLDGSLIWLSYAGSLHGGDFWTVDRVADVTGDGTDEVVGGSFDYNVYLFNGANGDTLWTFNTGNRLYTVRGAPDLSGNGSPDVLAGTQFLSSSGGGRAYALEGRDVTTGVSGWRVFAALAEIPLAGTARVQLSWSCNEALAFNVYRYEQRVGRVVGRQLMTAAYERGEMSGRELLDAIRAEKEPAATRINAEPLEPRLGAGGTWRYDFMDWLDPEMDPTGLTYRLAAVLPGGGESFLLELAPLHQQLVRPLLQTATVQPNPFNPATTIRFELDRQARVSVTVHDIRGRRVANLPPALFPAGASQIRWVARDTEGRELPAGIYVLTLNAGDAQRSLRATLIK